MELRQFDYDLKTKNLLVRGAKWLFDKLILEEMQQYTILPVAQYYNTATERINTLLNKEWTTGVVASGALEKIEITSISAQKEQLLIRSRCSGSLHVTVSESALKLNIRP